MPTDLRIGVAGDTKKYEAAIDRAKGATERYKDSLIDLELTLVKEANAQKAAAAKAAAAQEAAFKRQQEAGANLGRGMMTAGAAIGVGLGLAAKAAIDWESAWAGVTKTTSGSDQEMAQLEGQLRKLATTLPASHDEIAAVAEAAGQLGVKRQDIAEFTRVMVAMGVSTNLTAEDAATAMARFSNIMQLPMGDVQRLGSAIVALGNDGASTEQEILDMSLRIAGAGHVAGFTAAQVLAIANALSSLGIEVEAGGSAISSVMINIDKSVAESGTRLDRFAQLAGMNAQEFATQWKKDPAKALLAVETGLNGVTDAGGNTFDVLADLGITEIRQRNAVLALASGHDVLAASLKTGDKAWVDNTALMNEANKRYDTTASKLQVARNQVTELGIELGSALLPALGSVAEAVTGMLQVFNELPGPVKDGVVILGTLVTVVGTLGGAALILAPKIRQVREELALVGGVSGAARKGLGGVTSMLGGPWGIAIGVGVTVLGSFIAKHQEAAAASRTLAQTLDEETGAYTKNTRAAVAKALGDADVLRAAEELGLSLHDVTDAAVGNEAAMKRVNAAIEGNTDASMRAGGPHSKYAADVDTVRDAIHGQNSALEDAIAAKRREMEATGDSTDANDANATSAEKAAGSITEFGDSAEDAAAKLQALKTQADELLTALNEISDTNLSVLDTEIAFREGVRGLKDELGKKSKALYASEDATRKEKASIDDNRSALDGLIGKSKAAADAVYKKTLKTKGAEAAGRAWDGVMSANVGTMLTEAHRLGLNETQTRKYIAAVLGIPESALTHFSAANLASILAQARSLDGQMDALDGKSATVTLTKIQKNFIQDVHTGPSHLGKATGGPIGRAASGLHVRGPGSSTSDEAGLYALSNGEYVNRTKAVETFGVPFFDALNSGVLDLGKVRHGGRLTAAPSNGQAAGPPSLDVRVYVGDREITDIVRTEVSESNRGVRRRVMAGQGGAR